MESRRVFFHGSGVVFDNDQIQSGPAPVTSGVITPLTGVITQVTHLEDFIRPFIGVITPFVTTRGPLCSTRCIMPLFYGVVVGMLSSLHFKGIFAEDNDQTVKTQTKHLPSE